MVGGVVGGLTGGATSSGSDATRGCCRRLLPTVSVAPLPTSSPLVTDPVGAVTSAVPLPSSSVLPSVAGRVLRAPAHRLLIEAPIQS